MPDSTLVIAGSSGLIGSAVCAAAEKAGYRIIRLVRREPRKQNEIRWTPEAGLLDSKVLDGVIGVINLAGAPVSKLPWTGKVRAGLRQSRLDATNTLAQAILALKNPPAVFISGSATGFYGNQPGVQLDENTPANLESSFLARLAHDWELASQDCSAVTRVVNPRTGMVLAKTGALTPFIALTKAFLGAHIGKAAQHWPWISLRDEAAAILHLVNSSLSGPVNLVAPAFNTQVEILRELATVLHRPHWIRVPEFLARLGGAGVVDLLLRDQLVSSQMLISDGFKFSDPNLTTAMKHIFN